jgi:hypothetical protein
MKKLVVLFILALSLVGGGQASADGDSYFEVGVTWETPVEPSLPDGVTWESFDPSLPDGVTWE